MPDSAGVAPPARYRIHVGARLEKRWAGWFAGLDLAAQADGTTILAGPVPDQAHLHILLVRVRDLGLTLIQVELVTESGAG